MAFKLFPKIKRLPTLVGIFILVIGIAITTYLTSNVQQFFLKAEPALTPKNIKTSNLTSSSFTISWVTPDDPISGYIRYGKSSSLGNIGLDDRDQKPDNLGQYLVHHVTLNGLEAQTTYYFKIVSGEKEYDENGKPYSVTTTPIISPTTLPPTYGVILEENGQPAKEAIVYLQVGNSNLVSALTKSSGNWLISLSSLADQDLKGVLKTQPDDLESIFVQGRQKTSKAIVTLDNNSPVPPITLGQDYDFRITSSPSPAVPITTTPPNPSFDLINPASGAAIPGQPLFRGTALPEKPVQIEVESESSFKGEVAADAMGNWSWQAPSDLSPGEHTVTVTSVDNQGNLITIVRKFVILASGVQVVEAATPSATPTVTPRLSPSPSPTPTPGAPSPTSTISPTPTLTPTPTSTSTPTPKPSPTPAPTLTLTPTPSSTATPLPESGDLLLTLILLAGGVTFITVGATMARKAKASLKS